VTDPLPEGTTFVSASGSGWTCAEAAGTVTCTRTSLAVVAAPAITIIVTTPLQSGLITNTATVSATTADRNSANSTASAGTTVLEPGACATIEDLITQVNLLPISGADKARLLTRLNAADRYLQQDFRFKAVQELEKAKVQVAGLERAGALTTEDAAALTACIDALVAGVDLSGGRPPIPRNGRYRKTVPR
jgi:hypothetical protein